MDHQSLIHLFEASVENFSDNIFLWEKRSTEYRGLTYREAAEKVYSLCAGFLSLGIKKGDRIALISEGRNDWVISEIAVMYCGAVNVPLSVRLEEPADVVFRLKHSGCRGVIVSGNHLNKLKRVSGEVPGLEFVLLLDSEPKSDQTIALPWQLLYVDDLVESGREYLQANPGILENSRDNIQQSDYANICYTSGTSTDPKGIILTHLNYLKNVEQASLMFDVPSYFTSLHILPWDHSFAHTVGIYALMRNGASLASLKPGKTPAETIRNIPVCIREVRPYFLLSVPALASNFKKNIERGVREKGRITWGLFKAGLKVAIAYNREGHNKAIGTVRFLKPLYRFFDTVFFKKIRKSFGGRLRFFVGGGALLDIELQRFFYAIGMPMYQGYGLTEASPVISCNTPDFHKLGSSGKVVPMLDLKICTEDGKELSTGQTGEIIVRGDNVMAGYWQNPQGTARSLRDGWLYTGDLGYLDEDGYLFVLGRTKSLLIGSDGEKYSPEGIEEAMMAKSAFFDQVLLFNNQNSYTTAIIGINKQAVKDYLKKMRISPDSERGKKAAISKLKHEIAMFMPGGEHKDQFPQRWLPSAVAFFVEPFTEKNGMLNSTMKIVRHSAITHYKDTLDYLYTPEGKDFFNAHNQEVIARI